MCRTVTGRSVTPTTPAGEDSSTAPGAGGAAPTPGGAMNAPQAATAAAMRRRVIPLVPTTTAPFLEVR